MSKDIKNAVDIARPILAKSVSCCTFGFIGEKEEQHYRSEICHANLRPGYQEPDVKFYYTSLRTNGYNGNTQVMKTFNLNESDIESFGQWMLSDNSPFKSFLGDRDRQIVKEGDRAVGILIETNPDDDLDNMFALSIMGRYVNEKLSAYALMLKLITEGMNPAEAWYVCHMYLLTNPNTVAKAGYLNAGHTSFDGLADIKRLVSGDPHKGTVKLNKSNGYSYPKACARFHIKKFNGGGPNLFTQNVKPSGAVNGRWSSTKSSVNINTIMTSWETYRKELINAIAD